MSLGTYNETRPWAKSIKERVVRRTMPPWFLDKNIGIQKYKNDPSLSDADIATIVKWVDEGARLEVHFFEDGRVMAAAGYGRAQSGPLARLRAWLGW